MNDIIAGRMQLALREPRPVELRALKGLGPQSERELQARDIRDQLDLLLHVPRKYRVAHRFLHGEAIVRLGAAHLECIARITRAQLPKAHSRAPMELWLDCEGQELRALWFHPPAQARRMSAGTWLQLEGPLDLDRVVPSFTHPNFKLLVQPPEPMPAPTARIEAVYPSHEGIRDGLMVQWIRQAAQNLLEHLRDVLGPEVLRQQELPDIATALRTIHALGDFDDPEAFEPMLQKARERLVFEEFYTLQFKLTEQYVASRRAARAPLCEDREVARQLVRQLPFQLTQDQSEASAQIAGDLARSLPMRRLLQGDVGSGKTAVALIAAAIACGSGQQVALMAPTDILARQHGQRAQSFLGDLPVRTALLTGSQPAAERQARIEALGRGELDLVIGTHALIQPDVRFERLGLVIVDEQHKFGVEQSEALMAKGRDPHLLAMTATPIPRSLAHAVFGDLDLSVIRQKPPGRQPVRTVWRDHDRAPKVYQYVRERIEKTGEQAYFVYPMVEASQAVSGRNNVTEAAEMLANGPFKGLRVGVLHGRMEAEAKEAVMGRFVQGQLDVLCATTVIEVGVDVARATMMVIESAEVFGLSQLHQLRGRVGRGTEASLCVLLAASHLTPEASERLEAFSRTDDGFVLAETDLRIRGPGQFLGLRQAGMPEFRFGDILRDGHLLEDARRLARRHWLGDAAI